MIYLKPFVPSEICLCCDGCCRYAEHNSVWAPLFLFEEIVELTEKNIVPTCLFTHPDYHPPSQETTGIARGGISKKCSGEMSLDARGRLAADDLAEVKGESALTKAGHIQVPRETSMEFHLKRPCRIDLEENDGQFFCSCFNISGKKCSIYPDRPLDCRLYPFILTRKDNKVCLAVDESCPYAHKNLDSNLLKGHVRYLIKFFASRPMELLLKQNPEFIQQYPADLKFLTPLETHKIIK